MHMKEYPIILDDEELEDLLQVLKDVRCVKCNAVHYTNLYGKSRHVESAILQLEALKAQNTEDYK